jgi:peptidoglycan hydrolase-like protein with peptidoglycan-binding domain
MRRLGPAVLAVLLLIGLTPGTAHAYANAFFPTQSSGNRGADVLAIQYLLQHNGQSAPADGVFGASTVAAAKAFQTAKGLGSDGIVGPQTWGALVPTISSGASGAAVRALQVELNAKRRLSLPVDGVFSTAVRDAVIAFQTHAGIGADGIVGPISWRNLAWHYDYPDFTANLCDQDPDGNGTAANWATSAAVAQLE